MKQIKTIDINAKEWFDKLYGNSYFSVRITINYQIPGERVLTIPMKYGYGDQYIYASFDLLKKEGIINKDEYESYWSYCLDNNIILRNSIHRGCKKRDVVSFAE